MSDRYSVAAKKFKRSNQKFFCFKTIPKKDQVKTNEVRHCESISIKPEIGHEGSFKARLGSTRNSWSSWVIPDPVQYKQTDARACREVRGWLSRVYSHFVPYGFY